MCVLYVACCVACVLGWGGNSQSQASLDKLQDVANRPDGNFIVLHLDGMADGGRQSWNLPTTGSNVSPGIDGPTP